MKRRLLIIAIFLLLGAVVNVAVAWGCVAFVDVSGKPGELVQRDSATSPNRIEQIGTQIALGRMRINRLESWRGQPSGDYGDLERSSCERAGWPAYSMTCMTRSQVYINRGSGTVMRADTQAMMRGPQSGRGAVIEWGIEIWPEDTPHAGQVRVWRALPLAPIWPGFTINTLLYAAVLWLLICGPFALRRFLRVQRGLCPKCAYPMGESSVCTECGESLAGRA